MAQRVETLFVDDIDGGDAAETMMFALDGVSYEIDLSDGNASALRDALAPYVGVARRTGGRRERGKTSVAKAASNGANGHGDPGAIRAWARSEGFNVSDRGRIPSSVAAAYAARN